jgi:hypothetical protein
LTGGLEADGVEATTLKETDWRGWGARAAQGSAGSAPLSRSTSDRATRVAISRTRAHQQAFRIDGAALERSRNSDHLEEIAQLTM